MMSDAVGVTLNQFGPVLEYVLGKVSLGSNKPGKDGVKNRKAIEC